MRRRLFPAPALPLFAPLLLGCADQLPRQVVQPIEVPASLLTCRSQPPPPDDASGDRELAQYLVDLVDAGDDCRSRLAAVARIVTETGKEKGPGR